MWAREKTASTSRSLSPNHFCDRVLMWRFMNVAPLRNKLMGGEMVYDSAAIAFASMVLPQPGGPYSKTPRGALKSPLIVRYSYIGSYDAERNRSGYTSG